MTKRYLVSFDLQKDTISALCFRSCKKVLIGVIDIEGMALKPCPETNCPYLESQMSEPVVKNHKGHDCYLRKPIDGAYGYTFT